MTVTFCYVQPPSGHVSLAEGYSTQGLLPEPATDDARELIV